MSDFLKRLKKSVETGELDGEITEHHNAIIEKTELKEYEQKVVGTDKRLYNDQVSSFLGDDVNITKEEYNRRNNSQMQAVNEDTKVKSSTNLETIKLLVAENKQLKEKIEKNNELIEFLQLEINKPT